MTFFSMLYQLIIGPLEILFEIVYGISFQVIQNPGLAIIPVSLTINILLLPLYLRADYIQKENRDKEKSMAPMVKHIKSSFKGDERYMMLQAYYRIENYKPIYALRSSISLFLQVPFFMAAYHVMSNLSTLDGVQFGFISNLAMPDGALRIGGFSINVLPILMTLVNLISSRIYTKDISLKDRIQLYALAFIFLILLYRSPSGLVFYWLLNNVFSLAKNIVLSTKHPKEVFFTFLAALGIAIFAFDAYSLYTMPSIVILLAFILVLPSLLFILKKNKRFAQLLNKVTLKDSNPLLFFMGCLLLAVLTGILIPSAVVGDSPMEFIIKTEYSSPLIHILNSSLLSFGTMLLWPTVFYYLSTKKTRRLFEIGVWLVSIPALINYMFFGTKLGTILPLLQYEEGLRFTSKMYLVNSLLVMAVAVLLMVLWIKMNAFVKPFYCFILAIMLCMSIYNCAIIIKQIPAMKQAVSNAVVEEPSFKMSKNEKNVVVICLDKAVNAFVPYIFNEKPELRDKYQGFVWYPNTISYGNMTNIGAPALYGGYEYTPEEINKRSEEWLGDKQNEADCIMPVLFSEEGYDVTVCDPPYAGYSYIPDLSIYNNYPGIRSFLLDKGFFRESMPEYVEIKKQTWRRNFFCYSLMKSLPLVFQESIYQKGSYYFSGASKLLQLNKGKGEMVSVGGMEEFLNAYEVLRNLPSLTEIHEDSPGSFIMMHNTTTHSTVVLQEPEYEPLANVDNEAYDIIHKDRFDLNNREFHIDEYGWTIEHYHTNVAALIQIANWLDYLREEGIYDNTRIIIVADHGARLRCFDDMIFGEEIYEDAMYFNPLLMVKDFNSTAAFQKDEMFMTNADTPTLAFSGIIDNPVNPYTGRRISDEKKYEEEQIIFFTQDSDIDTNNGNTFLPGSWYALRNMNIFDVNNWRFIGKY